MGLSNSLTDIGTLVRCLIKDQSRTDGRDSFTFESDNKFTLSEDFIDSTFIVVCLNGDIMDESDWEYDSTKNQVTIDPVTTGVSLNTNDIIIISYNYFKKYSDNEIQGFITCSLAYFVENRYKKVFVINSDDEIVAIDDLDPTDRELYFISIIASILIDPMNINVNIDGAFRITANRNKSDREQIAEAFNRYCRFVGDIAATDEHHGID